MHPSSHTCGHSAWTSSRVMALSCLVATWLLGVGAVPPIESQTRSTRTAAASEASFTGTVSLMNRRGTRPARSVSMDEVLVFYEPNRGAGATLSSEGRFVMATVDKTYTPGVLAVPRGATVDFPNRDRILHNVFSVSGDNSFDLDLMDGGESRSQRFDHSGLVRVFCNVHRDMVGYVWVLGTPHWLRPGPDGSFRFDGLPAGRGKLTLWHPRAEPSTVEIDPGQGGVDLGEFELRITRPRLPSHARKDGSNYRTRTVY